MAKIFEIQPFTMLDFPGEMACIVWFSGCNLRCVYCHNPSIVLTQGQREDAELISFLERRVGRLTGVVFSGGEPTYATQLPALMRQVKDMGFKVKLDTNGSNPAVVSSLLDQNLLDYVALDYKCPDDLAARILGTDKFVSAFRETLSLLIDASRMIDASRNGLGFEVRTTCHPDLMDEGDLNRMIEDLETLGYTGTYYIQAIGSVGSDTLGNIEAPTRQIDLDKLKKPSGFRLSARNFKPARSE